MLAAALQSVFILTTSEPYESMAMQSVLPSVRKGDNAFGENPDRRLQLASGGCAIENSNKQPGSACKCLTGFTGDITWDGTKHSGQCVEDASYVYYYYYDDGNLECTNPPTKPENGAVAFSNGNYDGSEATFTCDRGFDPSGATKIECKIVGNKNTPWPAPDSAPACTPAYECTDPPTKAENGDVVFSDGNRHGSVATFTCESGYELVGSASITCEAKDTYTPWPAPDTTPECILPVICGNGIVQFSEQCECNPSHASANGKDCR